MRALSLLLCTCFALSCFAGPANPDPFETQLNELIKSSRTGGNQKTYDDALAARKKALIAQEQAQIALDKMKADIKKIKDKAEKDRTAEDETKLENWDEKIPELEAALKKTGEEVATARQAFTDAQKARAAGKKIKDDSEEAKEAVSLLKNTLAAMQVQQEFDKLELKNVSQENKLEAISAQLDNAILGRYLRDKMEGLLKTDQFCAAVGACDVNKKPNEKSLKGLFDKKTHGSGK